MPEPQTKPVFAKADGTLVAVALQEPSLTLFESQRAMGFFVAHGCQEDSFTGRLQLEEVVGQIRNGSVKWRTFTHDLVTIEMEEWGWAARSSTGKLIVTPGSIPFVVLFITPEDYRQFAAQVRGEMNDAVMAYSARRLKTLPSRTKRLLRRWSDMLGGLAPHPGSLTVTGETVRISLPPKPKVIVRIGLPSKPKPKPPDPGDGGSGGS